MGGQPKSEASSWSSAEVRRLWGGTHRSPLAKTSERP